MRSALRKHSFIPPDKDQRLNGQIKTFFTNAVRRFADDSLFTEKQKYPPFIIIINAGPPPLLFLEIVFEGNMFLIQINILLIF